MAGVRRDVRYEDGIWLMRCETCTDKATVWYPIDMEFWAPKFGLRSCRACHNTKRRLARRAQMDAKAKQRDYYRRNREHRLAWVRANRAKRKDEINALRRAAYARKVAAVRAAAGEQLEAFGDGA